MRFYLDPGRGAKIFWIVFVSVLLGGCRTNDFVAFPPCPAPTLEAVTDIEDIILTEGYEDLVVWISEMDRYCSAIDAAFQE